MKNTSPCIVGLALLGSLLSACSSVTPLPALPAPSEVENQRSSTSLSHVAAAARSKQISHLSYKLWFGLDDDTGSSANSVPSVFLGQAEILFELKPKAAEHGKTLFLDLEGGTLRSIVLNGTPLKDLNTPERFDGHHIYFQLHELLPSNRIEIVYSHPYSQNGNGLYRFKDPSDGLTYVYSHFEPYNAHLLFPCFDQPDLKASYEVTVEAPESWQVITNTTEKAVTALGGRKSWQFPPSPVFSTYVFALHAGPFSKWEADASGIPIRLFSRKSLAKYVDHQEWLTITKKGLEFFSTQFGFPYPFSKYDQVLVPDFNAGAMENVGAVTFNERYIYRTRVTQDRRRGRADVILHEMAHMWFGDLVTMKWWNGLWLNESFATFMAAWAVDQATSFSGSWQAFFAGVKQGAYGADQQVTTHPIELPVPDTARAESIFDGITYGKGASALKQLSFFLGEDQFKEGLQRYFQKFAYKNSTLGDFIKILGEASGQNLSAWQKSWLKTSGVNTVRAEWKCDVDPLSHRATLSEIKLLQTPTQDGGYRPHKTVVALYSLAGKKGALKKTQSFEVTYSTAVTPLPDAVGKPCPDLVFPNENDYDYVKVEFDPTSANTIRAHLGQIAEPLTRQMIWHSLWEQVVDGKMKPQLFADTALKHLAQERDTLILSRVLGKLSNLSGSQTTLLKYLEGDERANYQKKIEGFLKANWLSAPRGSDLQLVWYQSFLDVASSPESLQMISRILNRKGKSALIVKGMPLDQERRWGLIHTLARNGVKNVQALIDDTLQTDATDLGEKASIGASALIPDAAGKKQWLDRILAQPRMFSAAKLRPAMWSYNVLGQEEFTRSSVEPFFSALPDLAFSSSKENVEFASWLAGSMYPFLCDPAIILRTEDFLNRHPHLPPSVENDLKAGKQEVERCIRARLKAKE